MALDAGDGEGASAARQAAGRPLPPAAARAAGGGGGKSGLHGNTVPVNGRRGRPQGQCHRKQTARPPRRAPSGMRRGRRVRVKRCGKSAPRPRRRGRQGKPPREQDRIGVAGGAIRARLDRVTQGRSRPAARVGRARRAAMRAPEEWPSTPLGLAPRGRTEPGLQAAWHLRAPLEDPPTGPEPLDSGPRRATARAFSTRLSTRTKRELRAASATRPWTLGIKG